MSRIIFSKSVQGESHKKRENEPLNSARNRKFPCQDKSYAASLSSNGGLRFNIACVCDGHGGAPYFRSEKGAETAVKILVLLLQNNIEKIEACAETEKKEHLLKNAFVPSLVKRWKENVLGDLKENPITTTEAAYLQEENPKALDEYKNGIGLESIYGCTVLCYVETSSGYFAVQIGDSDLCVKNQDGTFEKPVPEDENCFLNETTSICDSDAIKEFRVVVKTEIPQAVFCSTDGVRNSFKDDGQLFDFYKKLEAAELYSFDFEKCKICKEKKCRELCLEQNITDDLASSLSSISKRGSGDDMSIAAIVQIDSKKFAESFRNKNTGEKPEEESEKPERPEKPEKLPAESNAQAEINKMKDELQLRINESNEKAQEKVDDFILKLKKKITILVTLILLALVILVLAFFATKIKANHKDENPLGNLPEQKQELENPQEEPESSLNESTGKEQTEEEPADKKQIEEKPADEKPSEENPAAEKSDGESSKNPLSKMKDRLKQKPNKKSKTETETQGEFEETSI